MRIELDLILYYMEKSNHLHNEFYVLQCEGTR